MFCPKCGTQNPDNGKFCRSCGTDLKTVSDVLSGRSGTTNQVAGFEVPNEIKTWNRKGKPIHWEGAVGKLFSGLAFLVVAIALGVTGAAGGRFWWYWMLFPAFGALGSGIAQIIQLKKMEKQGFLNNSNNAQNAFAPNHSNGALPADYDQIENLVSAGNKTEAIKAYREMTGANLKDARRAIKDIERGEMVKPVPPAAPATEYAPPPRGSIYDTGELNAPPSITEGTTRHLEINKEGETMTLPQKK